MKDKSVFRDEISERNFVAIFGVLIHQLKLSASKGEKLYLKKAFKKTAPFSFDVSAAIVQMGNLELDLESCMPRQSDAKIRYSIEPHTAFELLKKYFSCHFLHNPFSRTMSILTSQNTTVQITPKGTAVVQRFYENSGVSLHKMPEVTRSNFNTMKLLVFPRSKVTGRALYSECFNHILTSEMLGPSPHVWSPSAKIEASTESQSEPTVGRVSELGIGQDDLLGHPRVTVQSPFYHRYFTNPESDCHVQYFESGSGLRVFYNKVQAKQRHCTQNSQFSAYSFSGKAFVQWLMDCSTLYNIGEAVAIGNILLRHSLIVPVLGGDRFRHDREALYMLSSKATCQWARPDCGGVPGMDSGLRPNSETSEENYWDSKTERERGSETDKSQSLSSLRSSHSNCSDGSKDTDSTTNVSLSAVLQDPGLSFLFRKHLEREQCAENLDACLEIEEFLLQRNQPRDLARIYKTEADPGKKEKMLRAAAILVRKRLALAQQLYNKHFSAQAHRNLNIAFDLQQQLDKVFSGQPAYDDLRDYMQTPVEERRMFEEDREEQSELEQILEPLHSVQYVLAKISGSIRRLMETDSYVNFLRSDQYAQAMQAIRRRE